MDLAYVKKLIRLLSESNVDELEIEEDGKKVRIVKRLAAPAGGAAQITYMTPLAQAPAPAPPAADQAAAAAPPPAAAPAVNSRLQEIKSPIVGTFYRSPAPDAAPFVQIGAKVTPGTVLCIVEAMKLMNEIESDVAGTIVKIMVENGQPVEYGQTLFLVEKA